MKNQHVASEGNSVMELQLPMPETPAKKKTSQRQCCSRGIPMPCTSTSSLEVNKEKEVDCSAMDTIIDSFGSLDLNKQPVLEECERDNEELADGEAVLQGTMRNEPALLQTQDLARDDEKVLAFNLPSSQSSSNTKNLEDRSFGFGSIQGAFMPVQHSISQYNLKNRELVDGGKYNITDIKNIGSLKRKLHTADKSQKRKKKRAFRPKVVCNLGRPIPWMEPKTPMKKNKRLTLKTPKGKKNVSIKKSTSRIDINYVNYDPIALDVEPTVPEREFSSIDIKKHSEDGNGIVSAKALEHCFTKSCVDFGTGLCFLTRRKRTTMTKKWEVKDYSRIMTPNLQKIKTKRRMRRKRWEVGEWQSIARKFQANYLKRRRNKKISCAPELQLNIFQTKKQLSPCFISEKEALDIDESLTGMTNILASDDFQLFVKSIDIVEDDINIVQKHQNITHESDHGMLVCYQEKKKHGPHVELGVVVTAKGRRQEKLDKLEHGELAHPWKLHLQNEVKEGDKHNRDSNFWNGERQLFHERINSFIVRTRVVQGNRTFSQWGGSVMDSIIGVFLTQNVSDFLSSSAFMSLAAAFPNQSCSNQALTHAKLKSSCKQSRNLKAEEIVEGGISSCEQSDDHAYCDDVNRSNHRSVGNTMEMVLSSQSEWQTDILNQNSQSDFNQEKLRAKKLKADAQEMNNKGAIVSGKPDCDYYKRLHEKRENIPQPVDSVNWQAVREANVDDIAEAIKVRGQHHIIAGRIKKFLDEVYQDHKEINLEWLRKTSSMTVRKYLTHIEGIGLKSVECVRLLALKQIAFPVDVNVGRIAIRLGWVPMKTLPVDIQIHVLEEMPVMDNIQKYLWPRLMELSFEELYELHYQMITFGKVYCTKRNPNCQSCVMKDGCKYHLSEYASARHATLPMPMKKEAEDKTDVVTSTDHNSSGYNTLHSSSQSDFDNKAKIEYQIKDCGLIIEEPASPEPSSSKARYMERDIEDLCFDDPFKKFVTKSDTSSVVSCLTSEEAAFIPGRRLKIVDRLRTKHSVYEIEDESLLFKQLQLESRHAHDKNPYLFAMCTPDETKKVSQPPQNICNCKEFENLSCNGENTCPSCNNLSTQVDTIRGTILIPCRTAMRGSFPLNGTYFQVNEVFVDHESSINPISVRRELLCHLKTRDVYFGASTSAILKGLSAYDGAMCFYEGFICLRAFNRKTRRPELLPERFHISTVRATQKRKNKTQKEDLSI